MSASEKTRQRLLAATLRCVDRWGLDKTSLEDVAREADLSRATVYRYFPGGREQLVHETVVWEVGQFFQRLEHATTAEAHLPGKLRCGLMFGHRAVAEHALLQRVLATEPEALLAELSNALPLVEQAIRAYFLALLRFEPLRPDVSAGEAADYLTRMFLSYVGSQGQWDFSDPAAVDELVRTQFVAGVLVPAG
jgi:AcrR family transcriptional regulator